MLIKITNACGGPNMKLEEHLLYVSDKGDTWFCYQVFESGKARCVRIRSPEVCSLEFDVATGEGSGTKPIRLLKKVKRAAAKPPAPTLLRYTLPVDKPFEGWGYIVIDTSIGYFSAISDFGNYAYLWSSPGNDFREFLLECDNGYLLGKLLQGRSDAHVLDEEETERNVQEMINKLTDPDVKRAEQELLKRTSFRDQVDLVHWHDETNLGATFDLCEMLSYGPCPQAVAFCERLMPRLRELLRAELEAEKIGKV
jgi:hypothetical protein